MKLRRLRRCSASKQANQTGAQREDGCRDDGRSSDTLPHSFPPFLKCVARSIKNPASEEAGYKKSPTFVQLL
jgi:hypothetical protein